MNEWLFNSPSLPATVVAPHIPLSGYSPPQIDDLHLKVFFAAVNVLARVVMKDVANYDTHCELRRSGNQQTVERKRRLNSS